MLSLGTKFEHEKSKNELKDEMELETSTDDKGNHKTISKR